MPDGRSPQRDGRWSRRPGLVRAGWSCVAAGLLLGIATIISRAVGAIDEDQVMGLALPAWLLVLIGLTAAVIPDPVRLWRHGLLAGLRVGSLLRKWRAALSNYRGSNGPLTEQGRSSAAPSGGARLPLTPPRRPALVSASYSRRHREGGGGDKRVILRNSRRTA
jgi:hypothetical protein